MNQIVIAGIAALGGIFLGIAGVITALGNRKQAAAKDQTDGREFWQGLWQTERDRADKFQTLYYESLAGTNHATDVAQRALSELQLIKRQGPTA